MSFLESILRYIRNINGWKFFFLIVVINSLLTISINFFFLSDGLYYQTLGEQFAIERIDKIIQISKKWQWISYAFIPIFILIRICFSSVCIYIGCFLGNSQIRLKDLFKVSLLADFVFILAGLAKLVILIFFKDVNKLEDLQFQPLSFLELFPQNSVDKLFIYPFSIISVFELLYWLVLAWLLSGLLEKPFGNALTRVASSYGAGLLLWILFVMFLTVNLT